MPIHWERSRTLTGMWLWWTDHRGPMLVLLIVVAVASLKLGWDIALNRMWVHPATSAPSMEDRHRTTPW